MNMNKFYIVSNSGKDKDGKAKDTVREYLEKHGRQCLVHPVNIEDENQKKYYTDPKLVPDDMDCILVLGGDGTLTHVARDLVDKKIPIIGVNLGTLGYLAELNMETVYEGLDCLMAGKAVIENRMMLTGTLVREGKPIYKRIALNDIVLSRGEALKIVTFNVYVNGELLNEYRADGIIAASPTGSTAYSLSAGGPVVDPTASMIVLTPISYHSMINRSIVLSDTADIIVDVTKQRTGNRLIIGFDGDNIIELQAGDRIIIKRSEQSTRILKVNKISFLERLRDKMSDN